MTLVGGCSGLSTPVRCRSKVSGLGRGLGLGTPSSFRPTFSCHSLWPWCSRLIGGPAQTRVQGHISLCLSDDNTHRVYVYARTPSVTATSSLESECCGACAACAEALQVHDHVLGFARSCVSKRPQQFQSDYTLELGRCDTWKSDGSCWTNLL